MELLSGDSGGQGASILVGEWLTCPGSYWEYWYIIRLRNTSSSPIVIESIENEVIVGTPALTYVYTGESFLWNSSSPILSPNTPAEGCAHTFFGSATLLDTWEDGEDTIAELSTGLLVYQNSLPNDLIAASTPPFTLLHTFGAAPETWNPLGGLEIPPGGSIAIACGSQIHVEITCTTADHELAIAATLPALAAEVGLLAHAPWPASLARRKFGALFVGTGGQIHRYDHGVGDEAAGEVEPVVLKILSRSVAPAGIAGEALFTALYLNITNYKALNLTVTPMINGVRQDSMVVQLPSRTVQNKPVAAIYELPLLSEYLGLLARGLRGTWFTFEITAEIADEHLSFGRAEVELEVLRETQPSGVTFADLEVIDVAAPRSALLFLGGPGDIREWDSGNDDAGGPIPVLWQSLELAPAGQSGECIFTSVYLPLFRSNSTPFELLIESFVDGELQDSETLEIAAAAGPMLEVIELPLTLPLIDDVLGEYGRTGQRGAWFYVRASGERPDGELHFYPPVLEYEVVRETQADASG